MNSTCKRGIILIIRAFLMEATLSLKICDWIFASKKDITGKQFKQIHKSKRIWSVEENDIF